MNGVIPTRETFRRLVRGVRRVERGEVGGSQLPPARRPAMGHSDRKLAKTTEAISQGSTGGIEFWAGETLGSETATGVTEEAYCRFADVASGAWVLAERRSNGWEIYAAEC